MSDLISRSALIKRRRKVVEYDEAGFSMDYFAVSVEEINKAPIVEAVPVVHGEWIEEDDDIDIVYECSECGKWFVLIDGNPEENHYNFCPACGADMRKKVHE